MCTACEIGSFCNGGVSRFCEAGTYSPAGGLDSCLTCPDGKAVIQHRFRLVLEVLLNESPLRKNLALTGLDWKILFLCVLCFFLGKAMFKLQMCCCPQKHAAVKLLFQWKQISLYWSCWAAQNWQNAACETITNSSSKASWILLKRNGR